MEQFVYGQYPSLHWSEGTEGCPAHEIPPSHLNVGGKTRPSPDGQFECCTFNLFFKQPDKPKLSPASVPESLDSFVIKGNPFSFAE